VLNVSAVNCCLPVMSLVLFTDVARRLRRLKICVTPTEGPVQACLQILLGIRIGGLRKTLSSRRAAIRLRFESGVLNVVAASYSGGIGFES
jgi:hypothetical protein